MLTLKLSISLLLGLASFGYAQNSQPLSLEQASEKIKKETQGKVLSATTNEHNGVKSHRIQVLTKSGRVKVYQLPVNGQKPPERPNSNQGVDSSNYRKPNYADKNTHTGSQNQQNPQPQQSWQTRNNPVNARKMVNTQKETRKEPKKEIDNK